MTEKEFWLFLKRALAKGRMPQASGHIDNDDLQIQKMGEHFGGHSVLFESHDRLPIAAIVEMGKLLFAELNRK